MNNESRSTPKRPMINIPGDHVIKNLNALVMQEKINNDHKHLIWWFYDHARTQFWSFQQAGEVLGGDSSTAAALFNGATIDIQPVLETITEYRNIINVKQCSFFVETPTFEKIDEFCFAARSMRTPAFIYSASHIGKTRSLEEIVSRNPLNTSLIRCPAAPTYLTMLQEMARANHISHRTKDPGALRYRIMDMIDPDKLYLIDELHQALISCNEMTSIKILEFMREICDRKKCGMVFCGTQVLKDEMEQGRIHLILDQFRRRGILKLLLPPVPPIEDAETIAKHFSLPKPKGEIRTMVKAMLRDSGIGQFIYYIQSGKNLAEGDGEKFTWAHFTAAYDIIDSMSWKGRPENVSIITRKKRR